MSTFVSRFAPAAPSNIVIGRCSNCERTVRTEIVQSAGDPYFMPGRHIGRIGGCLMVQDKRWVVGCSRFPGGCSPDTTFTGQIEFKPIAHALRKKAAPTKCGGSCRAAKGPSCDCECGGNNHGAAHHGG